MKKLISFLLLITLTFSICAVNVSAKNIESNTIDLNYSGLSIGSAGIRGNVFTVNDITGEYPYLMLVLCDTYGNECYKQTTKVENRMACFYINSLSYGEYEISIYHNNEEYGSYDSCMNSSLYIQWYGNSGYILDTPAFEHNCTVKSNECVTEDELRYFLNPSDGIESDSYEIIELSENITKYCKSSYEKALAIHDWIANNIYYNYDICNGFIQSEQHTAKAVYYSHLTVCEGYTNLFVALARAAGIPARKIIGISFEDYETECRFGDATNHAWAEFYADGRWIITDVTWDSNNRFENGVFGPMIGCVSHFYFDMSLEGLSMEHKICQSNIYDKIYLYKDYPEFNQNNNWIAYDYSGTAPMLIQNKMFIPVRAVIEAIGGEVIWEKDGSYDKITCNVNNHNVQMWVNYGVFYVDGIEYYFDVPPQIVNGITMIPLRSIFEPIGCTVEWSDYADEWYGRVALGYVR